MVTIYGLIDPRDEAIHYVGRTNKAGRRLIEHRNEHGRVNQAKTEWLDDLASFGFDPIMVELEQVADEDADARELHWIRHGRAQGWPLVNKAHGYDTTQAKVDRVIELAVRMGVIGKFALEFTPDTKRQLLATITNLTTRQLSRTHEAMETARLQAEKLENLLEYAAEAAREIVPAENE